ncbi:thaumatin-like protein [Coniophora puteana RWD-64-598 SS2]|uniref:Thaumatin-like protein n=1 Tax=Coniophora puteana (strain RWD-64-598) TaxID=741705 RepID=A0A5M3MG76_CONPW|nr:thaumatin-like protein [Coniophora puteana RWD-64-598 SS2]EIW78248.1 thaumatin-like protein [Coniophora puteana RWD-64-598 SS2]
MKSATSAALLAFATGAFAKQITVYNGCPFTIWPGLFTGSGAAPSQATGWEAAAYTAVTFAVPDNWTAGRIWGRRDCDFSSNPGPNSCLSGGCNGGLLCTNPVSTEGVPPASLAEFTLDANGEDYYDVSLVDGANLPIEITSSTGCHVASCPVDLGPNCPAALQGPYDTTGFPLGCKSACYANLDGNQADSANCCSGSHNTAATCPPSGVAYYSYFKDNCPDAYAYAYDESSGTALWTCATGGDYTVTFCPPS